MHNLYIMLNILLALLFFYISIPVISLNNLMRMSSWYPYLKFKLWSSYSNPGFAITTNSIQNQQLLFVGVTRVNLPIIKSKRFSLDKVYMILKIIFRIILFTNNYILSILNARRQFAVHSLRNEEKIGYHLLYY